MDHNLRMLDVQKDRFRQMVATAILELWKKETGSLASVFIEATVCITSCNSRMTVIQLSDHFPGLIPEPPMLLDKIHSPGADISRPFSRQCHLAGHKRKLVEHYQDMAESSRMGWFNESLETFDKQKDGRANPIGQVVQQDHRLLMDSNNNQTGLVDAEGEGDFSEETDKDEMSSDDSDMCEGASSGAEDVQNSPSARSSSMGAVCAGTGYYTASTKSYATNKEKNSTVKADKNDSGIQDMSTGSLVIDMSATEDDCANNTAAESKGSASDAKWHHMNSGVENGSGQKSGETNAVDLSQHDTDLVLSPPQNYTEQVRDVIRSRLLNGKQKLTSSKSAAKEHAMDYFPMSVASTLSAPKSSEVHAVALCRPFDGPGWPVIKREKSNSIPTNGRMLPQHYTSSSPLPLFPLHKNLLDSMSTSAMAAVHPSLHKLFGLNSPMELSESKVFADSAKEPEGEDKQQGSYAGMAQQFPDPKGDSAINNAEQKSYKCNYCQKTFLFKSKYHEHLPVHTSARPFECHMCTRTYKYKYDLRVHLRTHLGIPTKSTICPFCSGKFMTNKLLRHHIKEAHREQQQISEEQCALSLDSAPMLSPTVGSV